MVDIYVEYTADSFHKLVLKASCLFEDIGYFRLLFFARDKYERISHIDPIKPIKGEPDNISHELERVLSYKPSKLSKPERRSLNQITWFTLEELMNIDLDKRLSTQKPKKDLPLNTYKVKSGEKSLDVRSMDLVIDEDVLERSFEEEVIIDLDQDQIPFESKWEEPDDWSEINNYNVGLQKGLQDYDGIKDLVEPLWEEKFGEELPNKIKLQGTWLKRREFGNELEDLIEFLDNLRTRKKFNWGLTNETPNRDEIRIVTWV